MARASKGEADDFERSLAPGEAPAALRRALRGYLVPRVVDDRIDVIELIVSELLANVGLHTDSGATIRVECDHASTRITVDDDGPGYEPAEIGPPLPLSEHGYGLWVVDQLADELHISRRACGGTSVSVRVSTTAPDGRARASTEAADPAGRGEVPVFGQPEAEMAPEHRDEIELRLANLQALTESGLTRLQVDELLGELLNRVREILDADTAAVLLLDPAAGDLVARAARGIEDEVRQGVRVPLGRGFAGRIAAFRQPIRLDRVDSTTVTNPILWEKGIEVMLGVPLLSGDVLLGVLHVGRLEPRPFGNDDVELLEVVAERVAAATQARQHEIDRAAADTLERSLLPTVLPRCEGLELTARYVPAEDRTVGGDWYDVFTLPSGQLWIVVGDVAGHGLAAAVVMGRIRSALRAYTVLDLPPPEVLRLLDRKMELFEMGTIATVAVASMAPPYDTAELAVAGHPPPVIARPGQRSAFAAIDTGLPLGAWWDAPRSSTWQALEPGDVMAFYTDGLVERRDEPIDAGLERLRRSVSARAVNDVARDVMHALLADTFPQDDIALVVMRRTDDDDPDEDPAGAV